MKKMLIVIMLLTAVVFMGNIMFANAANNSASGWAEDYKESSPC